MGSFNSRLGRASALAVMVFAGVRATVAAAESILRPEDAPVAEATAGESTASADAAEKTQAPPSPASASIDAENPSARRARERVEAELLRRRKVAETAKSGKKHPIAGETGRAARLQAEKLHRERQQRRIREAEAEQADQARERVRVAPPTVAPARPSGPKTPPAHEIRTQLHRKLDEINRRREDERKRAEKE